MAKFTAQEITRMLAKHPNASLPRIFEAALSGITTRNDFLIQGPRDAVIFALECVSELLDIKSVGDGDN